MTELNFAELMELVRKGDDRATTEMMDRYGGEVRRLARVRLRHGKLRRILESSDILQSVMGSFFRRADDGEYDERVNSPDELLRLLATMVRFKVIDQLRRTNSDRRGGKLDVVELIDSAIAPESSISPAEQLIQEELVSL
jgi:DNA-directed RNA polymerase specialized sigma24 family protein